MTALHPKTAAAIHRRRTAGESWASLAADFGLSEAEVREVVRSVEMTRAKAQQHFNHVHVEAKR